MAKRYPLRITVIKKLSAKEVYGPAFQKLQMIFLPTAIGWRWEKNLWSMNPEPCPLASVHGPGMTSIRLLPDCDLEEIILG